MKSCPTCNRTYPDDTLAFCLVDGSILSAPYDPQASWSPSHSQDTEPPPTEMFRATVKAADTIPSLSSRPYTPEVNQTHSSGQQSRKRGLVIGTVVLLMLVAGAVIALNWSAWFGNNNSLARQSNGVSATDDTVPKASPSVTPTIKPSPSITPQSTPSPKPTPSLPMKIDITGTWNGTFANRDAILYINSQEGDSFSGILKNSKGAIVAVSGHINRDTRQISMQENRVVEGAVEGDEWVLGANSGSLSTDGKKMSGSGRDKAGHVYSWRFTK